MAERKSGEQAVTKRIRLYSIVEGETSSESMALIASHYPPITKAGISIPVFTVWEIWAEIRELVFQTTTS